MKLYLNICAQLKSNPVINKLIDKCLFSLAAHLSLYLCFDICMNVCDVFYSHAGNSIFMMR